MTDANLDELRALVEQIIADGEAGFKEFTPRVNKRLDSGRFGGGAAILEMLPEFGDDAAAIVYALATNDALADLIEQLPRDEAIAFIRKYADEILDSLDDGDISQKTWEARRQRQAARGKGLTEQGAFERLRKKQGARWAR
jgi:hypothetical protein